MLLFILSTGSALPDADQLVYAEAIIIAGSLRMQSYRPVTSAAVARRLMRIVNFSSTRSTLAGTAKILNARYAAGGEKLATRLHANWLR